MYKKLLILTISLILLSCNKTEPLSQTASLFNTLTTSDDWQLVSTTPLQADTYHPQGLKKIGDYYYLSTVEIIEPTTRFAKLENGYDRSTGKGQGYLQKFDSNGKLITSTKLGQKDIYHPGGIDYDGKFIYVPVAEYRPNSSSIIYKVDPNTMQSSELFRYNDHIGGVVYNKDSKKIHAVSWGSRKFYKFNPNKKDSNGSIHTVASENKSYYIDYQDGKYLGNNTALFSGIKEFKFKGQDIAIGGLELRMLDTHHTIIKQIPIKMLTNLAKLMTGNPFDIELTDDGLMFYFAPDDNTTTIYIYKANIKI